MSSKGFGSKDRSIKKTTKKGNFLGKDKLLLDAFSLHSKGRIKEASEIYNFLIKNKYFDPRIFNNLGTIYLQLKDFDREASNRNDLFGTVNARASQPYI